jgi:hypothetical protein
MTNSWERDTGRAISVGTYLADLDYGWQRVRDHFAISGLAEWDFTSGEGGDPHVFIKWLDTLHVHPYSNKYLVVVATEPKLVAAWCYDGRHGGFVELQPKA